VAVRVASGEGRWLELPGRRSLEVVAAPLAAGVTLRRVEIAPDGAARRRPHLHPDCEEVIHVLSGRGVTSTPAGDIVLEPGDTLLVPRGEPHVTRGVGEAPLVLLCFFPVGELAAAEGDGLEPGS